MDQARDLLRAGKWQQLEGLIEASPPAEALHLRAAWELARKQPEQALACIRQSLELESSFSQRNTLAVCLLECGREQEAAARLQELLTEQPDNADLWFNLARADHGLDSLRQALRCRPGWRAAEVKLLSRLVALGHDQEALELVRRDLSSTSARLLEAQLVFRLGRFTDTVWLCLALLQQESLCEPARLLLFQAALASGQVVRDARFPDELEKGLHLPGAYALVPAVWKAWPDREGLLIALLRSDLVADAELEEWLTNWRREFRYRPQPGELYEALAAHNFTNEFCFLETAEEVEGLLPDHPAYPLYRPLPEGVEAPALVVERHLREPARERQLAGELGPAPAGDLVSRQYEQSPYPRWRNLEGYGPPRALRDILGDSLVTPPEVSSTSPRVLIAGCGTGRHALLSAQRLAGARVWAIDVSLPSLAYARRQSELLGVSGIEFRAADLLELPAELPEQFEVIESVGVLHHLADPSAGLRGLVGRLHPQGWMRLGFYSRAARRGLEPARQLARSLGPLPLREIRAELVRRLAPKDLEFVRGFKDFYSLSGLRDLLLHEREQEYDLEEVAELLRAAGLRWRGFDCLPDAARQGFVARFGRERLGDFSCWLRYDSECPAVFAGMYIFWCCLDEQPGSDATRSAGKLLGA
jgi:2-polyprenyl-3-methyl-5-hydroxy-6-metoxy-1,4-benzoquinol methylase